MTALTRISPDHHESIACAVPQEYLTFRVGAEEYGISILCVQEIRSYQAPLRMPGASAFSSGVLNLRGEIVPVVDLRVRFDTPQRFDAMTVTVVVNLVSGCTLGVVVDSVSDVLDLKVENIRPAPALSGAVDSRHITGIASVQQDDQARTLVLLDIDQLIASAMTGLAP